MRFLHIFLFSLFLGTPIDSDAYNVDTTIKSLSRFGLSEHILTDLTSRVIPKIKDPISLNLSLAVRAFNNIDQIDGSITMNIWLRYNWKDPYIRWNPKDWGNVSVITLDTNPDLESFIWTPDIFLYNTAEKPMDELFHTKANVYYNGDIFWSRPGLIKSTCTFDMTHFPYDQQDCYLKFGSWSYDSNEIFLGYNENPIDVSNYQRHDEWDLVEYNATKNVVKYECCEHPYHDIEFSYTLRRRPDYYNLNVVVPTFATAILIVMSLLIPLKSGERISFAVTILLSIIVFLLIVSDNLPRSDTEPLLSRMIIGLIYYSLVVLIFTIVLSYIHHYLEDLKENEETHSEFIDNFLEWVGFCDSRKSKRNTPVQQPQLNRSSSYHDVINALESHSNITNQNQNVEQHVNQQNRIVEQNETVNVEQNETVNVEQNETVNVEQNKNNLDRCINFVSRIEKIFMVVFLFAFIIYCAIVFSQIPSYR